MKIIVIGGGISGLVAGIYALKAGFDAEIYELHSVAGGECTGWERKGYPIDGCIHWLTGTEKNTDLYKIWETCNALGNNIQLLNNDYIIAHTHNNEVYYFYTNLEKLEDELLRISPEDEKEIKDLIISIKGCQSLPIPANKPDEQLSDEEKNALYSEYAKAGKQLERGSKMSVRDYAKCFRSPIIQEMISAIVPESLPLTVLFVTLGTRALGEGCWPAGGSYEFTQRMKKRFEKMGGTIHLNAPVKKIVIENGKAIGIISEKNEELIYADYVVPTTDASVFIEQLLEGKYKDSFFESRFNKPESYPLLSATIVSLGVKADISNRPHELLIKVKKPVKINNTTHNNITIKHYGYDPKFCANGKWTIGVTLNDFDFDYWLKLKNTSTDAYKLEKKRVAECIINEVEDAYPEIKGKIEMIDVATPLTFNRYCKAYKGAYMGFISQPGVKQENHKGTIDGIENLYIGGQWIFSSGGLPMAAIAGKFAIQRICKQEGLSVII